MSGPFGSTAWMSNPASGFYDFEISNSLRFEDGDSAYLNRTPSSAGNRRTWTFSTWVKRANLGVQFTFFGARGNNANEDNSFQLVFKSSDAIAFGYGGGVWKTTTQLFRDPSAWLHVVFALDTTQGTGADRTKLYINGTQVTSFTVSNTPGHNLEGGINKAIAHRISHYAAVAPEPFDGYLAETCLIDGTALTGSSFGELKNDIWIPKDTSGLTFGTNGFRLEYKQVGTGTASTSTIGADTSGEDNHWTSNSLVASDVMPDSPTLNFATLNSLSNDGHTLTEGNLHVSGNVVEGHQGSTFFVETGKWYFEGNLSTQQNDTAIGLVNSSASVPDNWTGETANTVGYLSDGRFFENSSSDSYSSYGTSDIAQFAFDADTGEIWIGKNNTWQNSGDPAAGTGEVTTVSWADFSPAARTVGSGAMCFNFGQDSSFAGAKTAQGNADGNGIGDFFYAPPSGFLAICTSNLPDPVETVDPNQGGSPQDYFQTKQYTGNGQSSLDIDLDFTPNFVWIKDRTGTYSHVLANSVSGDDKFLVSNSTAAEETDNTKFRNFLSKAFRVGGHAGVNANNNNYVSWSWKAGTSFSNDASSTSVGNVDSAGTVNTDVGFSIINFVVTTDATMQIAHGLGKIPKMIISKNRDTNSNWDVYHSFVGNEHRLKLNSTAAIEDQDGVWADTTPTSSVFYQKGNGSWHTVGGNVLAYCFAEVDGYSKFGSYVGNGNADGTFVYTGFRPAFIIYKKTSGTGNWGILDNKRSPFNLTQAWVAANLANAETNESARAVDFLSNGFKARGTNADLNTSSGTYIYMAFAEQPFKYANAR